jgi:chaperonin GroES
MKFEPLRDRIVIKKDEPEHLSKGGIIIPEVAREISQKGTVLEVGPGRISSEGVRIPMEIKRGDKVLFPKYSGMNPIVGEEKYFIIPERDVLAIINIDT